MISVVSIISIIETVIRIGGHFHNRWAQGREDQRTARNALALHLLFKRKRAECVTDSTWGLHHKPGSLNPTYGKDYFGGASTLLSGALSLMLGNAAHHATPKP
ncbi:hypothetical protein PTI98_005417 [Pleurotus ostreatus]|nr:hypothetical protein PTI98_005417 [Pleurotus ostreatus]